MRRHETRRPRFGAALAGALLAALVSTSLAAVPSQALEQELIVNGGFESGTTGWIVNDGNPTDDGLLSTTSDAYAGQSAALITNRATTGSGPLQVLSGKVQAGETYNLSARIRYDGADAPASKQFFATMHYGGGTYTNLVSVTAAKGTWATLSGTFTVPATQSTTTARLFFETPWTSNPASDPSTHLMDFRLDDVSLTGAAPPAPPSKTIEVLGKFPGEHNPVISHKFGADAYGFVDDGRVYLYMTNDTQGYAPSSVTGVSPQINYGEINQITLISSEDLVNWTDHGEIDVAGARGVAPFTNNSWAPGVAKKVVNGQEKYFLYYANGGGSSNVITGSSPLGPWTSERTSTLIDGTTPGTEGVAWKFDPAPLVAADGTPYLFFGGGPAATSMPAAERFNNPKNIRVIQLGDDMVSTTGTAAVVDAPVAFEAAQVFERNGMYYLSYSSHFGGSDFGGNQVKVPGYPGGGEIGYMMSSDPMSWPKETYSGVLFPNQSRFFGAGTGGNNHQSVFELDGKYYFTYHAPTLNKRINGDATQGYRSTHIQELTFNPDGTIQQVVGDFAGVEQVKNLDPYQTLEAETFAWQQGLATKKVGTGSAQFGDDAPHLVVHDVDAGDWSALSAVDFGAGAASVSARVKPLVAGSSIDVRLDDRNGPVVATITPDTEIGEWADVAADLTGVSGIHDVYFTFSGPQGSKLAEIDTWSFEAVSETPVVPFALTTESRCVAGKAVVTVRAVNSAEVPIDVAVTTPYGAKSFKGVAPGKSAYQAFATRTSTQQAGTVTVTATATVDGQEAATKQEAAYNAVTCS